jgi:hypothetical protein
MKRLRRASRISANQEFWAQQGSVMSNVMVDRQQLINSFNQKEVVYFPFLVPPVAISHQRSDHIFT